MSAPIKPGDVVRTPSGRTATVLEINADGSRELLFADDGERAALKPRHLFLLRAAAPGRWPKEKPAVRMRPAALCTYRWT